jgi:hypothetical protein
MLDHVERRRFLVEPARENPVPLLVGALDVELDESAGQLLIFPRRGGLAGAKPDDDILPTSRLAGVERDILDDPVTLVEDAEHGDALRHWGDRLLGCGPRLAPRGLGRWRILPLRAAAARGERERDQQRSGEFPHAYSGIHGS